MHAARDDNRVSNWQPIFGSSFVIFHRQTLADAVLFSPNDDSFNSIALKVFLVLLLPNTTLMKRFSINNFQYSRDIGKVTNRTSLN